MEAIDSYSSCLSSLDFSFNLDCCMSEQFLLIIERCSSISRERCFSVLFETESEETVGIKNLMDVCG